MAQSLRKAGSNIKDLSSFPDFEVNLNLESLLTLDVENQHAVTHFEIENLERETPWCARYYRHQNSYSPVAQASATGQLSAGEPPTEVLTCADKRDDYSSSETGDSESDEDFANKGCKTKNAHQKKERFSLVQVKVTVYWKLGFGNPLHDPLFRMLVCL